MFGKGVADGNVGGMPGMQTATDAVDQLAMMQAAQKEQEEKLQRLAMLGLPVAVMQAPVSMQPEPLQSLQAEQVNQALRQKGLPPLGPQEQKLLQDVNGKIKLANAEQGAEIPQALPEAGLAAGGMTNPKAAIPADQPVDPHLQKAMQAKGVDPKKLKSAETSASSGSTPEKLLSTETYLQMHESMKTPAKELAGKGPQAANGELPLANSRAPEALTAGAVAGASQKELGAQPRKGEAAEVLPEGAKPKLDPSAVGGSFGGALAHKLNEPARHDVYLPGADKPEEMRNVLLGEVGSSVALHAHKGGGEMRLVIHPDDMGELKLKVGTKNGKVEVEVTAQNEDVAKLIRGGSKELENSLREQNLSLAKLEVTVNDTSVASTDTKTSLNEQFFSQNQQHSGFSQGTGDDGRSARWGSDQGGRNASNGADAENSGRSAPKAQAVPKAPVQARDSSRRLDVVA
ncbi:MAG TPA: flagellar hook-length control protein FliK [Bdellovibrionota bacterium]